MLAMNRSNSLTFLVISLIGGSLSLASASTAQARDVSPTEIATQKAAIELLKSAYNFEGKDGAPLSEHFFTRTDQNNQKCYVHFYYTGNGEKSLPYLEVETMLAKDYDGAGSIAGFNSGYAREVFGVQIGANFTVSSKKTGSTVEADAVQVGSETFHQRWVSQAKMFMTPTPTGLNVEVDNATQLLGIVTGWHKETCKL